MIRYWFVRRIGRNDWRVYETTTGLTASECVAMFDNSASARAYARKRNANLEFLSHG